jgi:hypothetical protein
VELDRKHCPQCEMQILDRDQWCPFCNMIQPEFAVTPGRWVARIGSIFMVAGYGIPVALAGLADRSFVILVLGIGLLALTSGAVVASWRT